MDVISYSDFRKNLATSIQNVVNNHNPLIITNQNSEPTVLMSLKDFNAYQETAYLLSNPTNAQRLRESLAQAKAGQGTVRALLND